MNATEPRTSQLGPEHHPPEAWPAARALVVAALKPIDRFLRIEAASGVLLLVTAAVALGWANSPFAETYQRLLETPVELQIGGLVFEQNLHFVVNEVLMTLFFFVVGVEIRREIHHGELSELRRAALPVAAALGGMVAPALLYTAFNHGTPGERGWGVPMATDIAFAVGVLALLGRRVPAALRVLLLTLAIADDIGAVLVIAIAYSSGVQLGGLLLTAAGVAIVFLLQKLGVRAVTAYVLPGIVVWEGLHVAGIHPTLAGVVLGMMTPATAWLGAQGLVRIGRRALERIERLVDGDHEPSPDALQASLRAIQIARREALPPAERLAFALHPWVAFVVMPIFALANAGVTLDPAAFSGAGLRVAFGIAVGLVVGKPLGVVLASALAVRLGLAALPGGVSWRGLAIVGAVAGIGFTMAIFIADLAFPPELLAGAKLAVIAASAVAGILTLTLGVLVLPARGPLSGEAGTAAEAEGSTTA
jgi:NhaA family Na+:H+ antiporter